MENNAVGSPDIGNSILRELTHEETLAWINEHKVWRRAYKTKPMWARPVTVDEVGKGFQTADRAIMQADGKAWLCVGIADEPWFQTLEKIEAKYERGSIEVKQFSFDDQSHEYQQFLAKPGVVSWTAQVAAADIAGFSIRPGYDPNTPLHSAVGGYVVMEVAPDPYTASPADVWLVQQALFESTYEILPDPHDRG